VKTQLPVDPNIRIPGVEALEWGIDDRDEPDDPEQWIFWVMVDLGRNGLRADVSYGRYRGELYLEKIALDHEGSPPWDVTAEDLRAVKLDKLRALAYQLLRSGEPDPGMRFDFETMRATTHPMPPPDWITEFKAHPRPGRPGRDDRDYAEIAERYVGLRGSRAPVRDLAQHLGISTPQARNLIYEARRRDLLTRVAQGRAGGELTEKARGLLDGEH
jgi:hypothetical protein